MKLSIFLTLGIALGCAGSVASAFAAEGSADLQCAARGNGTATASLSAEGTLKLSVDGRAETVFAAQSRKVVSEGYLLYTGYNQAIGQHSLVTIRERDGRALVQAFGTSYEFNCATAAN